MKPSIILFTTITFVISITLLIMQMINNNDKLITSNNKDRLDTQALLIISNLKNEIGILLLNKKDNLDEIVGQENFIEYREINIKFKIEEFINPFNINKILKNKEMPLLEKYFEKNSLELIEFENFMNEYFAENDRKEIKIYRNSQVKKIILELKKALPQFNKIKDLNEQFTYFDIKRNDKYFICNVNIKISQVIYKSSFIYNLNKLNKDSIKVKDFEITIS